MNCWHSLIRYRRTPDYSSAPADTPRRSWGRGVLLPRCEKRCPWGAFWCVNASKSCRRCMLYGFGRTGRLGHTPALPSVVETARIDQPGNRIPVPAWQRAVAPVPAPDAMARSCAMSDRTQRHEDQIALGGSVALADSFRHVAGLPCRKPTRPFWSHNHKAAKPKATGRP